MEWSALPVGDLAVRLAVGAIDARRLAAIALAARARQEIADAIPAAESIVLLFHPGVDPASRRDAIESIIAAPPGVDAPRSHRIEVSFAEPDAPDLPRLLDRAGIDHDTFVSTISTHPLRVRFLGFRPGFAYLEGIPEEWHLPRLETPRGLVPAGSFAIAGSMAGFYPDDSPGGWNLIGRSGASFWDPLREPPALLASGDEVRIAPVERLGPPGQVDPELPEQGVPIARVARSATAMCIVPAADASRFAWGLPAGGPFDAEAAAAANENVGNGAGAAILECALSGPILRFTEAATLSWRGGKAALSIMGERVDDPRRFLVEPGDELEIGAIRPGTRGYLAFQGGLAPPHAKELPAMLHRGDVLLGAGGEARGSRFRSLDRTTPNEIAAIAGPDPLPAEWRALLENEWWEVSPRSDRAGVRFTTGRKAAGIPGSLPSAGMIFGTIQWHPDGDLVAMGPDHPVTGGYLQPATIPTSERWKLAQLKPGDRIRWKVVGE